MKNSYFKEQSKSRTLPKTANPKSILVNHTILSQTGGRDGIVPECEVKELTTNFTTGKIEPDGD